MKFYSKQTGGFYDSDIHGENIPTDAVDVDDDEYRALFAAQAQGAEIKPDENGHPVAVFPPAPTVDDIRTDALRRIDADVDAIYAAVIGNRQSEYDAAEADANAYKAAGYSGAVPASVQSWATATGKTAKWAADDILATAANWRTMQADIRANRLARKQDVRGMTDPAEVDTVLTTWGAYVAKTRAALGV